MLTKRLLVKSMQLEEQDNVPRDSLPSSYYADKNLQKHNLKQINFRKIRKKIKNYGTGEEKHLFNLGKNISSLVDKLYVGEKYKDKWKAFSILKETFQESIQRYSGIYLDYFKNKFKEIEEQEKQALGYHLH